MAAVPEPPMNVPAGGPSCNIFKPENCVSEVYDTSNNSKVLSCSPELSKCFPPSVDDRTLYSKLNWSELFKNRESFMNGFRDTIIKPGGYDKEIDNLIKDVYGYTAGPTEGSKKHYVNIDFLPLASKNKCQDMNFAFAIREALGDSKSKLDAKRIFHIALHSEFPKYVQGKLKGHNSCGLYPKKADEELGSGSFHYKIDSYPSIEKPGFKTLREDRSPPYRTFEFNPDGTMRDNIATPFTIREGKEAYTLFNALSDVNKANLIKLHNMIYKKFIDYWNENIHTYRKSVGGKRNTRKSKKSSRTTRRNN